ncbi:hypothetical protein [Gemmatimonas sp.]|uniref:hypothetical protein n=1 Tax=Gemmatimonas sp. TaxID=1962908 RepID=UPI0035620E62
MNLAAQTLHLLRFDLLRMRWVIAACYAVLALAVITALGAVEVVSIPRASLPYLCTGLLSMAAAFAVQGDSPLRPEAFWRGQATRSSALFLEKSLLISVIFVLCPLVIALMAVASFNLTLTEVVQHTAPAARMLAMWVAVSALVAVSTTELKSAILLFLLSLIGFAGVLNLAGSVSVWLTRVLPSVPLLPVFLAIGTVIAVTYLRGLPRRLSVALAALLTGLGLFALNAKPSISLAGRGQPSVTPATLVAAPESLQVDSVSLASGTRNDGVAKVDVSLTGETPGARYSLSWGLLTAYFANGDSVAVSLRGTIGYAQVDRLVMLPKGLRLRHGAERDVHHRGTLAVNRATSSSVRRSAAEPEGYSLTPDFADPTSAILKRLGTDAVTKVRVDVVLNRYHQVEVASIPLNGDVEKNEGGRRLSFRRRAGSGPDAFNVSWSTLGPTRAPAYGAIENGDWRFTRPYLFVLENASRGDAVVMQQGNSQSSGEAVVLPGIERRYQRFELDGVEAADDRTLDADWLKGATLRVVHWELDGRLALSTKHVLPRR